MTYFEHIMRKKDKCLEKEIIQGTTPGAHSRGRPKTIWLGNIRLCMIMEDHGRIVEDN